MGNQLDLPVEGGSGRRIRQADFTMIKAAGFRTVRIPIRFSAHAADRPPYAIDAAFMERVRQVVQWATDAGLNAIIDMHHYDEIQQDPAGHKDRFVAMWRQIAEHFFNAPGSVWFELLNEPRDALTNATLPSIYTPALAAIRASNLARPVIIDGGDTSHLSSLTSLPMPDDPYVVPTFHYYEPFAFTHQGADFITPRPPFGVTFGSPADYARLDADLQTVRDYMQRTGRVPFVGEYGAIQDIPIDQRALYYGAVSHAFASIGVQSCAWSFTNTFQLSNNSNWITAITDVIATTTD
ncbi:cellulase family glycosylhydrolase [Sphingobium sp. CAP-1]|nr:cellulase family glycosylhydrolase [Sphingobium sp. CAP-1]